jgi:hypothetical protein
MAKQKKPPALHAVLEAAHPESKCPHRPCPPHKLSFALSFYPQ